MSHWPSNFFDNFNLLREYAHNCMRYDSELVHPGRWQSIDVSQKKEMGTHEVTNFFAQCRIPITSAYLQTDCRPNLPWAEDHFAERVCGQPINPGSSWRSWPYSNKANEFRDSHGMFNHNYMERYWPKFADAFRQETETAAQFKSFFPSGPDAGDWMPAENMGIRNPLGDLNDLVALMVADPLTRQAYLPIFFPEDTGAVHGGRVPCTLGYHFMLRRNRLSVAYFMRSCDLMRHFNDDCYLTARLCQWLLHRLKEQAPSIFDEVVPGDFTIFIGSLHIFRNDWYTLFGNAPTPGSLAGEPAVQGGATGRSEHRMPEGHGGQQLRRTSHFNLMQQAARAAAGGIPAPGVAAPAHGPVASPSDGPRLPSHDSPPVSTGKDTIPVLAWKDYVEEPGDKIIAGDYLVRGGFVIGRFQRMGERYL